MKHLFIVTPITLLLITNNLYAEVNMKDASYNVSFTDAPEIKRSYNSRSIYKGLFGFGWCSDLEKSLAISTTQKVTFKECDKEISFKLILEDHDTKSRVYESFGEKIEYKNGLYILKRDKKYYIFNRKGHLIQTNTPHSKTTYKYKSKKITQVRTPTREFTVSYNSLGTIDHISEHKKVLARYHYKNGNLTEATLSQNRKHSYEYNAVNNLELHTTPTGSQTRIAYNNDSDQVVKIIKPDGCQEYFNFSSDTSQKHYQISRVSQQCPNKSPLNKTFEFWSQPLDNGKLYLERYKIKYSSNESESSIEFIYHPTKGTPIKIIRNGEQIY